MTPIYHDNVIEFQHIAPGRAQRGGGTENEKKRPTDARAKHAQVAAPDFSTPRGDLGQLALLKFRSEGGTKLPQSQSKNDTTDNKKKIWFKSEVGGIFAKFQGYHEGEKPSKPCKGCSKSDFACMRYTTLPNIVWAWFEAQKLTQKLTQKP